jgi:F0F1-type ATP synthase assembly protein I
MVIKVNIILIIKEVFTEIGRIRMASSGSDFAKHLAKTQARENEQTSIKAKEKTKARKFFDKSLDFITSPGVGTVLTVFGAITCLSSPLGMIIGAAIAIVTMTSYSIARIRSTLRMRTIKRAQKKDLLLDSLDQKINKTLDKPASPELRKVANQKIMKILEKSISDEPISRDKKIVNIISGKIRYLSLTGAANWVLSILSLNPASIALSSTSMVLSNGLSYVGEIDYRKDKDLLDKEVLEKEGKLMQFLKRELGIEDKCISKLSNKALLKILSIKEAEISCDGKIYKSDAEMKDALDNNAKKYKDVNLQEYELEVGFIKDFGNLFVNSFSSQKYGEFFVPLSHRENLEKTTQDVQLQELNAFKKDELIQVDGRGKGVDIEMTEINQYDQKPSISKAHHSVKDIIKEEGVKHKEHLGEHFVDEVSLELREHSVDRKQLSNINDKNNVTRYSKAARQQLSNNNVEKPERTL